MEFKAWPKIARVENIRWYITEKIDGTNACINVARVGRSPDQCMKEWGCIAFEESPGTTVVLTAQSRTRNITPDSDNFGFARWVYDNARELGKLQDGYHFGEWWGKGIGRGYGIEDKRFSLFNVFWDKSEIPDIVSTVPLLCKGSGLENAMTALDKLKQEMYAEKSMISPNWKYPEGVILNIEHSQPIKVVWDK